MKWNSLIPGRDDRCSFCGGVMLATLEAVLVPDDLGTAAWWHMRCRDAVLPLLAGERGADTDDVPTQEATA